MNELEKKYKQKQEALKGIKELYYKDRRLFKKFFAKIRCIIKPIC